MAHQMKLILLVLLASSFAQSADLDDSAVRPMLEAHQWFELRHAVTTGKSPALYRGLVAAAFNDIAHAQREFRIGIRAGAGGDQQYAAHQALSDAYFRNGLYRRAAIELKRKWDLNREKTPPDSERSLLRWLEQLPDLAIVSRKPAAVAYTTWPGGQIATPLMINGQAARFVLDSDMNISVISEAGAKRLGMRISADEVAFIGMTGSSAPGGHTAVADRLKVGGTEFRNVSFLVVPDSTGKLMDYPIEERGILGLPVMLAIQTFRWNREYRLELGFHSPGGGRVANLCFDGTDPLVEATVESHRVAFVLDTGGAHSAAWPVFGKQFPALLQEATKGSREISGLSGAAQVDVAIMPELRIMVADIPMVLRPAPVLLTTIVEPSNWHYGTIGMDLLKQAEEVTLDFKAMTLLMK
jgi:hypothetical protein